ncbi:RTA1 like protein-domain-containing protein [Lipomyces japonicus]|uniref:RTA1 like protein-domain-containing protein n=1 Tax=Lipomyces japonicus TaxID=56871 RepID=UPI0034CF56AC
MSATTTVAASAAAASASASASAYLESLDPSTYNVYGYTPVKSANLVGLILFDIAWAAHISLGIYYRQIWFGVCMFIACGLETAGYIARFLSNSNPDNVHNFLLQIICLTLAPAFFMAGIYFLLAEIVIIWGVKNSIAKPWAYSQLFILLDIISIILQAAGGGLAATALLDNEETDTGTHIMVAGLAFQVFSTSLFFIAGFIFWVKSHKSRQRAKQFADTLYVPTIEPDMTIGEQNYASPEYIGPEKFAHIRNSKWTKFEIAAIIIAVVLVYIRSIYRVVELSMGWTGYLMAHEVFFLVLDGLMVVIAMWIMFIFYPGIFFGQIKISTEHKALLEAPSDQAIEIKF